MLMSVSRGIVFEQQAQLSVLRALCRGAEDEGPSFSFFLSFFLSFTVPPSSENGKQAFPLPLIPGGLILLPPWHVAPSLSL
jgi:hypothetical protein